ncbi:NADH-ubiquinone oxidoreductase-F iron-sulfur binding region domain-containing protein [Lapillicoccus sp.]|uniref:NADH-ubiquinone oxidoreductase-F iron-sulfur binding region domain-containing protein n=1 Tax=Lapillicoccus sp. TaxID=1909287 RepID=UPI0039835652
MRLLLAEGSGAQAHLAAHGPLVLPAPGVLLEAVEASGLLGRGGAGFPSGRKMRTVGAARRPVVLGNGCDGEPASGKDTLLLSDFRDLVLDGLQVAAHAVGAREAHLALHAGSPARDGLVLALARRQDAVPVRLHAVPPRYVASEESALVNLVNTGSSLPTSSPPRPYERGIDKRPTLVHNVETLAHLALIARHGPDWFRAVGDPAEPGTMLVTVSGPGARRVVEVATGTSVTDLLRDHGLLLGCGAVLVGGYFGSWFTVEEAHHLTLTQHSLRAAGGALGAGIVVALPRSACGLTETARVAAYLAAQSAGQCGPCVNGLPAIAGAVTELAAGRRTPSLDSDLERWLRIVPGRGACRHPDGAVRFVQTALRVFADDLAEHRGSREETVAAMIQRTVERIYTEEEENRFLEVTYAGGDKEILYFKDFNSGAMIQNIVDRAKKMAIKDFLTIAQKGIRVEHLLAACVDEFKENEDLPNTTNPDDWARISGKKGERIIYIRTLINGKDGTEPGRSIHNVANTGQYL